MPASAVAGPVSRPVLGFFPALLLGAVGGVALSMAFPRIGWWWMAIPAITAIFLALRGRSVLGSVAVGFVAGAAFYLRLIHWATLFLGVVPWLALGLFQAVLFMVGAVAITLGMRWWPRSPSRLLGAARPIFFGSLWTLRELLASHWPYKGFAWGRVGQSQSTGIFADLISWVGVTGVGWLCAVIAALVADAIVARPRLRIRALAAVAAIVVVIALIPAWHIDVERSVRIGGVQGGTEKAGYFKAGEPGEVLRANMAATQQLPAGPYDLIVWPETGAEWDPITEPVVAKVVRDISTEFDAPVVVGAVHQLGDQTFVNSAQIWQGGTLLARYDKRDPVPFGEYVPDRHIWERFAPSLIGMIQRGYAPGTTPSVFNAGAVRIGLGICFDVVDDDLMREHVANGAEVIIYPTNNADFGRTAELDQQITFAKLRAMESGRSVVQVSSVGWTQAFAPDGTSLGKLPIYENRALDINVPVSRTTTAAMVVAQPLAGIVGVAGAAGWALLGVCAARRRQ